MACNVRELANIQKLYGVNFTSNMFENISCLLGRDHNVNDIYYYLPWVTKDDNLKNTIGTVHELQLVFRLKVVDINNITLVCRNKYGKEVGVSSTSLSSKSREVLTYNCQSNTNIEILSNHNHDVDNLWMETLQMNINFKSEMGYSNLKNLKLPRFDSLYTQVSSITNQYRTMS